MRVTIIENLLEKRDIKKCIKALQVSPWRYKERHGRIWFNTDYRISATQLRKWC